MARRGGIHLYYAKQMLSDVLPRITPAIERAFQELMESHDVSDVRILLVLLGGFEEDSVFYKMVQQVLNLMDKFSPSEKQELEAKLSAAIFESGGAEVHLAGTPSPRLTRRIEFLKELCKKTDAAGREFVANEIKFCEERLKSEMEEEEEL
jgi:hypothetical protein